MYVLSVTTREQARKTMGNTTKRMSNKLKAMRMSTLAPRDANTEAERCNQATTVPSNKIKRHRKVEGVEAGRQSLSHAVGGRADELIGHHARAQVLVLMCVDSIHGEAVDGVRVHGVWVHHYLGSPSAVTCGAHM